MGVIQIDLFGKSYEIVGGKAYKIEENENSKSKLQPPPRHFAGGCCRQCNYAEASDGMHGKHCGSCDCCSENSNNN